MQTWTHGNHTNINAFSDDNTSTRYPSNDGRISTIYRSLNRGRDCAGNHNACVHISVYVPLFDRWMPIVEIVFWLVNNRHWANVAALLRLRRAATYFRLLSPRTSQWQREPRINPATMHAWCHYWQGHPEYYSPTPLVHMPFLCSIIFLRAEFHGPLWNSCSRPTADPVIVSRCVSYPSISLFAAFPIPPSLSLSLCVCVSLLAHCKRTVSPRDYHGSLLTGSPHRARHARWLIA